MRYENVDLNGFVDANYTFRNQKKYSGFWGRLRAAWDKIPIEEEEEKSTHERYGGLSQTYYSSPHAAELLKEFRLKEEEFQKRNSFSTALLKLINMKGKDNVSVYKKANIDRKLFSKIISEHDYIPGKKTIIALAIGMELTLPETQELLKRAGFVLSENILTDVIVTFFIQREQYDIHEINSALAAYDQKTLS